MKKDFIAAYSLMYNVDKKKAAQVYRKSSNRFRNYIIKTFKANARLCRF